jgi:hypothetical protein
MCHLFIPVSHEDHKFLRIFILNILEVSVMILFIQRSMVFNQQSISLQTPVICFVFLLSHYTYNTLQIYLAGQCQSLPIIITKHCHTVYIQINHLLVLPIIIVSLDN